VLHGWAPQRLLASYEPERRDVVEKTVASAASHLGKMAGDLPRDEASIQQAKGSEFYSLGLVLGYSYAGSPVIQPSAGPPEMTDPTAYRPTTEPGARLPHWWLPDGTSLYDRLGPGFTLLSPDPKPDPKPDPNPDAHSDPDAYPNSDPDPGDRRDDGAGQAAVAALRQRARDHHIPLTILHAPPSYPWADEFLLVRPDQHIAWRAADPADIDIEAAVGHGADVPRRPHSAIA
jgi:hypothetical protein